MPQHCVKQQRLECALGASSAAADAQLWLPVVLHCMMQGQKYTLRISSKADNIERNSDWYDTINHMLKSFQVLV
jgi:transcription elongation factor Elf1